MYGVNLNIYVPDGGNESFRTVIFGFQFVYVSIILTITLGIAADW